MDLEKHLEKHLGMDLEICLGIHLGLHLGIHLVQVEYLGIHLVWGDKMVVLAGLGRPSWESSLLEQYAAAQNSLRQKSSLQLT